MKKTITIMIGFFAIICFSSSVYAATVTWATAATGGGTLTVGDTVGSQVTYEPSPGVIITGTNTLTTYNIISANGKAAANAMAYNVCSESGQVAQNAIDLTTPAVATLGTPTANGELVTGFVTK